MAARAANRQQVERLRQVVRYALDRQHRTTEVGVSRPRPQVLDGRGHSLTPVILDRLLRPGRFQAAASCQQAVGIPSC